MMNKISRTIVFSIVLIASSMVSIWAADIKFFNQESYHQILDNNKNQAFLLVLWSLDCPPCYEELLLLGDYLKTSSEFKVILVSTDSLLHVDEIKQMILETHLQNQEFWLFSDAPNQQLRYAIDPLWYGELPRSYFFNQCHQRQALSGKLDMNTIESFKAKLSCRN